VPSNKIDMKVEGGEGAPLKNVSTSMQVRILHSTLAFLALIKHPRGLKIFFFELRCISFFPDAP